MFKHTLILLAFALGFLRTASAQSMSHNPEFREAFLHSIRGLNDWKSDKNSTGWNSKFPVENFSNSIVDLPDGRRALELVKWGNSLSVVKAFDGRIAPFIYNSLPVADYEKVELPDAAYEGGKKIVYQHKDKSQRDSTPWVETGYVQLGFESWNYVVKLIEPKEKNNYSPTFK